MIRGSWTPEKDAILGTKHGLLTILDVVSGASIDKDGGRWADVRCECGARVFIRLRHVLSGRQRGCGSFDCRTKVGGIPRTTPEERERAKARNAERARLRRNERKAAGKCVRCDRPSPFLTCPNCRLHEKRDKERPVREPQTLADRIEDQLWGHIRPAGSWR